MTDNQENDMTSHRPTRRLLAATALAVTLAVSATGCITVSGPISPARPPATVTIDAAKDQAGKPAANPARRLKSLDAVYEISVLTSIAGSAPVYNKRVVSALTPQVTGPSTYDAPLPLPGNLCMKDKNGRQLKVGIIARYNDGTTEYHSVPVTGGSTCRGFAYVDG
jgi:hypothetical protein